MFPKRYVKFLNDNITLMLYGKLDDDDEENPPNSLQMRSMVRMIWIPFSYAFANINIR